jgi:hypothetical protein
VRRPIGGQIFIYKNSSVLHLPDLPDWLRRRAAVTVCDRADDVDDAKMLLDMIGLYAQPEGTYARSDEQLVAAGEVCKNGHPKNKKNTAAPPGHRRGRCRAC